MNSGGEDILGVVLPILKLLCIAGMGFILSHPKIDIVPKATYKILSGLVFVLFLPCLIFIYLAQSISLENFVLWWFIPVNVVLSTAIGCILGLLVALICRPPPQFFRFTIIMTAFGNTGYIPLAVVSSFCRNTDNPFGTDCSVNGVAYVSFSQWVSVILAYTLVYHMMEPPLEYYEIAEEEEGAEEEMNEIVQEEEHVGNCLSTPLLVEAEWPGLEDKETELCKTPFIAKLFNGTSLTNIPDDLDSIVEENPNGSKSIKCLAEPKMVKKMRIVAVNTPLRQVLQPPVFASALAVLVGIIPGLKSIVFSSDTPLEVLTDSLDIISEATVPSIMLVIGGMLLDGPNESKLGTRTTVGIIIARLLVLPLIGIGVLYLADKWNFLIQENQLYRFVLFLQYTTPSAILLAAIASLRGYAVGEASAILFWQHVLAMFTLALHIFIYIKLSSAYS